MPPKVKSNDAPTYPWKGDYVVTVGGNPVFSHPEKTTCLIKQQQLLQDRLREGVDLSLPEFEMKVGQVVVADKEMRAGTIEY